LYEKNYVDDSFCGNYNDVAIEFESGRIGLRKQATISIFELYKKFVKNMAINNNDGLEAARNRLKELAAAPIKGNETKIGRNDPCTCGSGKKHKKCCGV